jgi:hypothetical protein
MNPILLPNPILVTALNLVIGYGKGAATAKQAYNGGRPILDVAKETTGLSEKGLKKLLDPPVFAKGGGSSGARWGCRIISRSNEMKQCFTLSQNSTPSTTIDERAHCV